MASVEEARWRLPEAEGLYDPSLEHDACGVGFIVNISGKKSHDILERANLLSVRLTHRGAEGAEESLGDGAGVMLGVPDEFYRKELSSSGVRLPDHYGTGIFFLEKSSASKTKALFAQLAKKVGFEILAWREVPINGSVLSATGRASEPLMEQVFLAPTFASNESELDKRLFILKKMASLQIGTLKERFYICSLCTRTVVYKGQFVPHQLWDYFLDFKNPDFKTHFAIVHTRFSTNTFPSWERAQPLRVLAHNGEINTLRGNNNKMRARQPGLSLGQLHTPELALKNTDLYPIVETGNSDSGCLDNAIEYLTLSRGKSLPETVLSLVPEAWQNDDNMDDQKKEYYKYQGALLEPWDGPALLTFSDGRFVGAVLDRNGLRPSRYYVTRDGFMVMASEVGVYSTPESNVSEKGRLKPGQILLVDTRAQRIIEDAEFKSGLVRHWDEKYCLTIPKLLSASCAKSPVKECTLSGDKLRSILTLFGYTTETLQMLLVPMFQTAKEALGSMGNDAALACVSQQQPLVYDYFKQLFAQVTNPPIDPFREKNVMSLLCPIGIEGDVNNQTAAESCKLWLESPIISPTELAIIKSDTDASLHKNYSVKTVRMIQAQNETLQAAIQRICEAVDAVSTCGMVVLSDKIQDPKTELPVSAALVVGAVHHHLIEVGRRRNCGLIIETAEAREVHQMCVLLGYGADAICPYLIEDIILSLKSEEILSNPEENLTDEDFIEFYFKKYRAAVDRGIFKVMAKMGISTLHSYKGAQIFEALGLADEVVEQCFRGTVSRIGGANFRVLEQESRIRHEKAFATQSDLKVLPDSGFYHMRTGGESHINSPDSIALLQEATKSKEPNKFKQYSEESLKSIQECTLRGQLEIVYADLGNQVPLDEVEPAKEIVKRFVTGAMSYGSISEEAHETLAIAMNSINGKSNTGEGGEDAQRYLNAGAGGPNKRSAIKQIASGRFGVTITYLSNSDEIQIKMAQGAKPGEGGELPGHKVSEGIAKTRNSVPGVGLISPPPHHDIYSIEDLAQLIYDLKCANPKARISVKLVSVAGVGVIAAGVAKGKAEHITISGHDGGTGASSWTGIKGAGLPWELGLSETHQILTKNDLRSRVVVQADGQLRTAFDVAVAAMLGADEFGFSTVPLIAMGCTMMRKCHLNTCPVGIATQDPELRAKFAGKPEHVVEYFFMLAEEIREIMAKVGARNFQDLVGKTEMLRPRENDNSKAQLLDFSKILYNAQKQNPEASILGGSLAQDFGLKNREAANLMMEASEDVLSGKNPGPKTISLKVSNADRTFGATLSNQISLLTQGTGYKDGTLNFDLEGHAGQSFGAFLINGVTLNLTGDANDYVGKGLSGGKIVIKPCEDFKPSKEHNSIVGNVCFYGATSGKAFIKGMAGERFCVRNSGAAAVVEGVGDHACEYMTGGIAVILGAVGKNFGAGMSGGIAYVIDVDTTSIDVFRRNLNDDVKNDVEVLRVDELDSEIFSLIKEYETETKSTLAQNILRSEGVRVFKVFPKSYKEALEKLKQKTAVPKKLASDGEPLTIEDAAKEENVNGHSTNGTSNGHATNGTTNGLSKSVADIEDIAGKLDKKTGFKKYKRNTKPYRKIEERSNDYEEIFDHKEVRKDIKKQAARCMDCGVPFCHSTMSGCPLGNIIPKFNDLVFHGKWKEALAQLLQTNNFPEFTGRVCPAPCEGACVLGINEPPVNIKNIECAIIDKGFEMGWIVPKPPKIRNGLKVAVVGSGPSGLSAADQLNKAGYTVTVFEKNNRIGGLLRYGIPSMKLSKDVVQRRVDLMATEGVIFKTNVDIGVDVDAETLKKDHDAVLLCTGAAVPRDLPVPGRKAAIGVNFAMDYLQTSQQHQVGDQVSFDKVDAKGLDVLVIGGGDTGCDCLATAMRQGAKSVTAFEIAEQPGEERAEDNPWPQYPRVYKLDYGHEEVSLKWKKGDPRKYGVTTLKIITDDSNRVVGVETAKCKTVKAPNGRMSFVPVEGTEERLDCQLILLAMGFVGPDVDLFKSLGVETTFERGDRYKTDAEGVFRAGDCRRGQSLVVWAISEGRQAARHIDSYLTKGSRSTLPVQGGLVNYSGFNQG